MGFPEGGKAKNLDGGGRGIGTKGKGQGFGKDNCHQRRLQFLVRTRTVGFAQPGKKKKEKGG